MRGPRGICPRKTCARGAALAAAAVLGACISLDRPPLAKRRFVLEATRPDVRPPGALGCLLVAPFHVQAPFAGPGFVHRRAGGEIHADVDSEFFVPPAVLLANLTRRWLADAGLFAGVASEGTRLTTTHALEVDVLDLSVDERTPGTPHAALELEFVLLDGERRIVRHGRLAQREPIDTATPEATVAGWNACLRAALVALEQRLGV